MFFFSSIKISEDEGINKAILITLAVTYSAFVRLHGREFCYSVIAISVNTLSQLYNL